MSITLALTPAETELLAAQAAASTKKTGWSMTPITMSCSARPMHIRAANSLRSKAALIADGNLRILSCKGHYED